MTDNLRPISEHEDHMTVEMFVDCVKCGGFIDYDGYGHYATNTHRSEIVARPSEVVAHGPLEGWTHVVWYNR